eukprot:TRINITY_DN7503_c0_g2_i1.p1 TRINITY_DN7503_c0_g2~~TRINITY_DN7503_c0_g2_i1.p1  ORF type:complete len:574 (+),score=118.23 TRINITY_DN7503_c0_g2_i1:179-1900(+)
MVTVGYGDVVPKSTAERTFSMIMMYLASAMFGYMMNTVSDVILLFGRSKAFYRKKIQMIQRYMTQKHINKDLQVRVREYLKYIWDLDNYVKAEESNFSSVLSSSLRTEIVLEVNGRILAQCKLISLNFSKALLNDVCYILNERTFAPEELIFEEGPSMKEGFETGKKLFFISSGEVEIFCKASDTLLKRLDKGNHFGELAFFSDGDRIASARSFFFSSCYALDRNAFYPLLSKHPADHEKFCTIRDKLMLEGDYNLMNTICYGCDELGHVATKCPKINYRPDYQGFIKYYLVLREVFMKRFERKHYTRFNSLGKLKKIINAKARVIKSAGGFHNTFSNLRRVDSIGGNGKEEEQNGNNNNFLHVKKAPKGKTAALEPITQSTSTRSTHYSEFAPELRSKFEYSAPKVLSATEKRIINDQLIEFEKLFDGPTEDRPSIFEMKSTNDEKKVLEVEQNFDCLYNFEIYFPHNNIHRIIGKKKVIPEVKHKEEEISFDLAAGLAKGIQSMILRRQEKVSIPKRTITGLVKKAKDTPKQFAMKMEDTGFGKQLQERRRKSAISIPSPMLINHKTSTNK